MATVFVPLPNPEEPIVTQRVVLDGVSYLLRFDWVARLELWNFSIATEDGERLTSSVALSADWKTNYTVLFPGSPPGMLLLLTSDGENPSLETLKNALMVYTPSDDL